MTLEELISKLEKLPRNKEVVDGFHEPHCDRGDYSNLAFDPIEKTTIGKMLIQAKSALGSTYIGWKGGEYEMGPWTDVYIGFDGECGEPINSSNFKLWSM